IFLHIHISSSLLFFFLIILRPTRSTLFPYTTLFRSLFDMASSGHFMDNAAALAIDIYSVDLAVLSHGHCDHGGGLRNFFAANKLDRKSTRLNSSHVAISYAVFCLKKKKKKVR